MPGPGRPFQKGWAGGPGRPRTKTAREAVRTALAQPSSTPGKTRLQEWADELASEIDVKIRMEILRWLEGACPKESKEPTEDEYEPMPMPADLASAIRAMGWVLSRVGDGEPSSICNTRKQGSMEPEHNGSPLSSSSDDPK